MKHFAESWRSLQRRQTNRALFLGFDYDGTLTPLVDHPDQAVLDEQVKGLLNLLAQDPRYKLAVVSGRSLPDISQRVGLKNITYVGNHGLEIEGPGIHFQSSLPVYFKEYFQQLAKELRELLAGFPGAWLEDKGLTMSLHYRQIAAGDMIDLKRSFHKICKPYVARNAVTVTQGKKIFEVRPPIAWNKGDAVMWLLTKVQAAYGIERVLPIYFGDDMTDSDVFKVLNGKGITVSVGEYFSPSAEYYLKSPFEVKEFLFNLVHPGSETVQR